jgi:hypothetical protein
MRFCFSCRKVSSGKPLYCNYCGRSYDVKLCPRNHINPRGAEVCSACGSRNLSTPQTRGSARLTLFFIFGLLLPFLGLLVVTLGYAYEFGKVLFSDPSGLLPLMLLGLVLGLFWLLWIALSSSLRRLISGPKNK